MKTLSLLALAVVTSVAHAQWVATDLHPDGYMASGIATVRDAFAYGGADGHAGRFDGNSFEDFNPIGAESSYIDATDGAHQFGAAKFNGLERAARWNGSSQSYEDWHPTGASESMIWGAGDGQAVGNAWFNGTRKALLWNGGGANDINVLHKDEWLSSSANAAVGFKQYGDAEFSSNSFHAGMWSGTAQSFVDFNPAGSVNSSIIDASATRQVGFADYGQGWRATTWTGSAGSALDLNPSGSVESVGFGTYGNFVAGYARFEEGNNAGVWDLTQGTSLTCTTCCL